MLRVNEIFHSIQGESCRAGWPCVFVRLTGCNLRCTYCDTRYAYEEGEEMTVPDVVSRVKAFRCPMVEITGGEPLIQEETPRLAEALLSAGLTVLVETNGSRDISLIDSRCARIVDLKCPSSGHVEANDYANLRRLGEGDELKFVLSDREDYAFARDLARRFMNDRPDSRVTVHFSPVFGRLEPERLVAWILEDGLQVRLNLQLHKLVWGPDRRGV